MGGKQTWEQHEINVSSSGTTCTNTVIPGKGFGKTGLAGQTGKQPASPSSMLTARCEFFDSFDRYVGKTRSHRPCKAMHKLSHPLPLFLQARLRQFLGFVSLRFDLQQSPIECRECFLGVPATEQTQRNLVVPMEGRRSRKSHEKRPRTQKRNGNSHGFVSSLLSFPFLFLSLIALRPNLSKTSVH